MTKEQKWLEWPELQMRWGGEQLIKRRERGQTTPDHDITRMLYWMAMIIYAANREYKRREALTQQVTELSHQLVDLQQQLAEMQQELEIIRDVIQLEIRKDES